VDEAEAAKPVRDHVEREVDVVVELDSTRTDSMAEALDPA
jgi:hypothetical protein